MSKKRFALVAVAALVAASCSQQAAPSQPAPGDGVQSASAQALPFEVPVGALFVARTQSSSNIYRIDRACRPLHSMNPSRVVFFGTLEAARRAGYRLSKEEGCH